MASSKIFSLEGKGLKLDTADDINPHIEPLRSNPDIEEVRFQGNTLGTEACEALAKVLSTKKHLKVRPLSSPSLGFQLALHTKESPLRLSTLPISSPRAFCPRFLPRSPLSSKLFCSFHMSIPLTSLIMLSALTPKPPSSLSSLHIHLFATYT
jgi:hypothetical protein